MAGVEPNGRGCLLLDSSLVRSGSALRERMRCRYLGWPVIVLCAGAEETARHEARDMGVGAR